VARRPSLPGDRPTIIVVVWDLCHTRPLYHCGTGSDGKGTMAERDLTAREDRFIGLCLAAVAIIIVFIFIVSVSTP
jgi:hypothetical protein